MWYGPLTRRQTLTSAEHLPAPFGPLLPTWYCIITAPLLRQKLLRCPCLAPMFSQARHGAADPRWPLAQLPLQRSFGIGGHGNGPRSRQLLNRSDGVVLDRSLGSQWPFALATCGVALPGDSESTVSSVVARRGSPLVVVGLTHMAPG